MEGGRGEDGGFAVCICSSIDGQGCHAVSLVEHGGARREHGDLGVTVSGEWYLQVEQESIGGGCRKVARNGNLKKGCPLQS